MQYRPCCFAKNNLPELVRNRASNASSSTINKFNKQKRSISRKGAVRAGKGFTLLISNEDLNDITRIVKSLEDTGD